MEAKEIMIGDWVRIDSKSCEQVTRVFDKYCDTYASLLPWEYIEPIPLTEEIMDKNFVKKNSTLSFATYDAAGILDLILYKYNGCHISINLLGRLTLIKYVHQLQQVLRLCGLGEMADNFKVE